MMITAIDTALENMGVAQLITTPEGEQQIRTVLTTLHALPDGRLFEYKEGQLAPLCWEWVVANECYWTGSKVIFIEHQFCRNNSSKERSGIIIQQVLHGIFLTLYSLGRAGKPVVRAADWWRGEMGLEKTNDHEANKRNSIKLYRQMFGDGKLTQLQTLWGKVDDVVEATLMVEAVKKNYQELINPLLESLHVEGRNQTRIPQKDRLLPVATLSNEPKLYDALQQRRNYEEFKQRRKGEKVKRENNRMMKKLVPRKDEAKKRKRQ